MIRWASSAASRRASRRSSKSSKNLAQKVDANDEKAITEVATIAANNDKEIGKKLAEAMKLVGATNGVITIEEGKTAETEVVVVQGMQFDRGYLSPHFVTNQESVTCEFENPYILIYEDKISNVRSLIPLLELISKKKEPLLIIAEDLEGEALATLVLNKLKGILQVCAVKAPGYGDRRKAMLEDIAALTGGKAIFKDLGIELENVQLSDLGRCKKVKIDAENTTITEGAGDKKAVDGRCEMIRREITKTDSEYDREKLQERLAKLAGGVAQLKVGGATETAMKERKALYEDSLARDAGGSRRRHRRRRRRGSAERSQGARNDQADGRRRRRRPRALPRPGNALPHDRRERRQGRHGRRRRTSCASTIATGATTPTPTSTKTCARPASSTPSR